MVRFKVHPAQRDSERTVICEADVLDRRVVRPSSGKEQVRIVIRTEVSFRGERWPIEVTLASRDQMGFRMLLGRQAVRGRYAVDPARSFVGGKPPRKNLAKKTKKKKKTEKKQLRSLRTRKNPS